MAQIKQVGLVVGIDKVNQDKAYRVIVASIAKKAEKQYDWSFECKILNEQQLKMSLGNKDRYLNVKLENGEVKGISASLSRFESANKPCVIISQLVNSEGRLLGYKVAKYDGTVKNVPIKEMLAYGIRVTKQNGIPVQNAIFVAAETNKKEHYKSYPGCNFIEELIISNKNKNVDTRRVNTAKNEKTLSKLEEIYNTTQINELKLGKKNGVDIRIFANPQLTAEQMHELRLGLQSGVNVRPLAFPEYSVLAMRYYIQDLKDGLNIKPYLSSEYNCGQIAELSLAYELGLDISKMSNSKLNADEMAEIRERLEKNIWKPELVKKDGSWN